MPESRTWPSQVTASKTKLRVWMSTMRPPVCISPARPMSSPGDIMFAGGVGRRTATPSSGFVAGKVCMPSTRPVSSKARKARSAEAGARVVGAPLLEILLLLGGERRLLEPARDLLRHLRAGEANRVVAGEVVTGTADHHVAAVEDRLVRVLPVGPADHVAVLGLD